jgi:hypothetical protein
MRAPAIGGAFILALAAAPALAQGAPSSNLNSINNSLAGQAQSSAAQQQQTTGANNQMMRNNRSRLSQPMPGSSSEPIIRRHRRH